MFASLYTDELTNDSLTHIRRLLSYASGRLCIVPSSPLRPTGTLVHRLYRTLQHRSTSCDQSQREQITLLTQHCSHVLLPLIEVTTKTIIVHNHIEERQAQEALHRVSLASLSSQHSFTKTYHSGSYPSAAPDRADLSATGRIQEQALALVTLLPSLSLRLVPKPSFSGRWLSPLEVIEANIVAGRRGAQVIMKTIYMSDAEGVESVSSLRSETLVLSTFW